MRRKDREVTDPALIQDIIQRCEVCRIGFNDNGEVYIVPLNFGYVNNDGNYTLYFHGAGAGRKFELAQAKPQVGFEMDTNYLLHTNGEPADVACNYTARFQSIIGNGSFSIVEDLAEKKEGLQLLMLHTTGKKDWEFNPMMFKMVTVFKLEVTKLSCKEHE